MESRLITAEPWRAEEPWRLCVGSRSSLHLMHHVYQLWCCDCVKSWTRSRLPETHLLSMETSDFSPAENIWPYFQTLSRTPSPLIRIWGLTALKPCDLEREAAGWRSSTVSVSLRGDCFLCLQQLFHTFRSHLIEMDWIFHFLLTASVALWYCFPKGYAVVFQVCL